MIKGMEGKLREKRRKFDQVVKKLKGVPNNDQISRIVEMVNDMGSLGKDIRKLWDYRLRDLKRWVENLKDRR